MSTKVIERVKSGGPDWLPANTPQWLGGRLSFGASLLQTAMRSEATRVIVQLDDSNETTTFGSEFLYRQRPLFWWRNEDSTGCKAQ